MKELISLNDYLGKKNLSDHLHLTSKISFHWSNWEQTCLKQREYYKNYNNNFYLTSLNNQLLELKTHPIWICNKVEIIRTDLYSLYESYLDSRLRLTWLERKDELLFSTSNEQGPYFSLTSMKWFNKDIYSQFVMRKILIEQFTLRSFRLSTEIPITIKFDNDVNQYQNKVSIHQLTETGVMLKISDKNFVNKIKNSFMLELKIPTKAIKSTNNLNIHDTYEKLKDVTFQEDIHLNSYQLESRILNFYGNLANSQRSGENEFFIFARYEDLVANGHNVSLTNTFANLVSKTKKYFTKELDLLVFELKAA